VCIARLTIACTPSGLAHRRQLFWPAPPAFPVDAEELHDCTGKCADTHRYRVHHQMVRLWPHASSRLIVASPPARKLHTSTNSEHAPRYSPGTRLPTSCEAARPDLVQTWSPTSQLHRRPWRMPPAQMSEAVLELSLSTRSYSSF
jgi:hypothetical protein